MGDTTKCKSCEGVGSPEPGCFKSKPDQKDDSLKITFDTFPKEALEVMSMLRCHQKLCDVEIHVGSEVFHAHKIVLAAASPYFRAMFTSGLKESNMSSINIQGVCPLNMAIIIRFAYSGSVQVSERTVCNLLPAATMFQVTYIIEACCKFLEKQLDPSNAIGIADFALQHGCTQFFQKANAYINVNFSQVSKEEEFLALSACKLVSLIRRDELNVMCESEVFNAVLRWVKFDEESRGPKMKDILIAVRCHFLTPRFLNQQIQSCDIVKNIPQCCDYLVKIIQDLTLRRKYQCSERTPKVPQVIYTAGGYLCHSLSNLECYNARERQWFPLADLPTPRSGLAGAFFEGKFYVLGGRNNSPDGNQDSNAVDCYDPISNRWHACLKMIHARNRVGVAVLDGELYAVGGAQETLHHKSVERFDPLEDRWVEVAEMNSARIGVGVAVVKRLLYAVGGFDGEVRLNTMEVYNPDKNTWTLLPSMRVTRSGAGVASLDNFIYAIGGYDGNSQLNSVERYNIETNEWMTVASMASPRSALSVDVLEGKIYALGGYDGTDFSPTVEVYDPARDKWTEAPPMSCGRSGHASGVYQAPCMAHGIT